MSFLVSFYLLFLTHIPKQILFFDKDESIGTIRYSYYKIRHHCLATEKLGFAIKDNGIVGFFPNSSIRAITSEIEFHNKSL